MASQMRNARGQHGVGSVGAGRPAARVGWGIALAALVMTPAAQLLAERPSVAYQDPAAAALAGRVASGPELGA